jgi:hypothetical protein
MSGSEKAAILAVAILGLLVVFQLLMAAGLPLGRAAWGGQHRVLPANLRLGSLAAAGILIFAGWIVLARAGLVAPGDKATAVRVISWVFAVHFTLNTVMNIVSGSPLEQWIMTPTAALLAACFFWVARSKS